MKFVLRYCTDLAGGLELFKPRSGLSGLANPGSAFPSHPVVSQVWSPRLKPPRC